ncbi:hypothetical protein BN1723_003849 [Verticillium longisporum]|uniref:NADP-dependent oxidoreductase domain-containing protein n=1 Tax=Verticillium longisporum TaxID=100787 RepID=A0A0G4MD08_VERLO|nr:Oxidoreductase sirO like protein [Verticillium longisporum]CRK15828.1 hypothetical protein BN1708_011570 [Verticillium longisporum]CRK32182.1 hypothetical protein BN1723_003849 [Verticillium longisporum]
MTANGIKIVFGGGAFQSGSAADAIEWVKVLEEVGIKTIDTAMIYGQSEEILGQVGAASRFIVDTKLPGGFGPELSTQDHVVKTCNASLGRLQTDVVDVYYIHAPDRRVPIKETLMGLNELHKKGAFKRLGLSNFLSEEIEEVVRVAKENSFIVPSVYQGNYSAAARRIEQEVIPTLRRHNIALYAYSPIAGGFLTKSKDAIIGAKEGRFSQSHPWSNVYSSLYHRPAFLSALDMWDQISQDEGITKAELAYRWAFYHSKLQGDLGDAIVIGARTHDQLKETALAVQNGPLRSAAVDRIDQFWDTIKDEALLDNFEASQQEKGS